MGISYLVTVNPAPPPAAVLLSLAPLAVAIAASAWRSRWRALLLPLFLAGVALLLLNVDQLRGNHIAWLYFFQHAGTMLLLAFVFGGTLQDDDAAALCSRLAIAITPAVALDADYLRYTRQVTVAWTGYFAISAALSVALFFLAPIEAWSVFAIFVTPIAVGAMFAGEYLIRRRVVPNGPKVDIAAIIKAYRKPDYY
ncbi:MAG: hypothetical protein FWC58_02770 [Desulfobulbus sp.]|nr:hypothetical protein [Desulfobulbus sp.]